MDLGAKGVPANLNLEQSQSLLLRSPFDATRKEDESHAGSPNGHALIDPLYDLYTQARSLEQHADRCAFAAWDDEPLDPIQFVGSADLADIRGGSCLKNRLDVLLEVPLDAEDTDLLRHA